MSPRSRIARLAQRPFKSRSSVFLGMRYPKPNIAKTTMYPRRQDGPAVLSTSNLSSTGFALPVSGTLWDHAAIWKYHGVKRNGLLRENINIAWPKPPPNAATVYKVARPFLPVDFEISDTSQIDTNDGRLHKDYHLVSKSHHESYVMRVAIPVEPFFKTESEVATLTYIRKHTNIPVNKVIAWSSSLSGELGFEWILMQRLPGESLETVWGKMTFEDKVAFTKELAGYMSQLLRLRFSKIGNIYFADKWNEVGAAGISLNSWSSSVETRCPVCDEDYYDKDYDPYDYGYYDNYGRGYYDPEVDIDIGKGGNFVMGRAINENFWRDKRALLPGFRGPFTTTRGLFVAMTAMLGQRIRHLSPKPGTNYYCESDVRIHEDRAKAMQVYAGLRKAGDAIFPKEMMAAARHDQKVLSHGDLSLKNILVDPTTFKITGIINWESAGPTSAWMAGRDPQWDASRQGVPKFIYSRGDSPWQSLEGLSKAEHRDQEDRERWERDELRKVYLSETASLGLPDTQSREVHKMFDFWRTLNEFEDYWDYLPSCGPGWLRHIFRVSPGWMRDILEAPGPGSRRS